MTAGGKERLMNEEARDGHDAEVDNQNGPLEEVDEATPAVDTWAEGAITPVTLTAGQTFSVTNYRPAGSRSTNRNQSTSSTMGFNPAITFLNALSGSGAGRPTGNIGDFLNGIVDIVFTT